MTRIIFSISFAVVAAMLTLLLLAQSSFAFHSWGDYHWARIANPLPLELGNNLSGPWLSHLEVASSDWNTSTVLATTIASGKGGKNCRAQTGRVEVCNKNYGATGWLGIAQIYINSDHHISKGIVKVNDTYFNTSAYDSPEWRQLVMCQEIAHTLGLDHQDEDFNNGNLGTCMDYTSNPSGNEHPNSHDFDELADIYSHTDSYNTYTTSTDGDGGGGGNGKGRGGKPSGVGQEMNLDNPSEWGQVIRTDAQGNVSLYRQNLGNGEEVFTFVTWVDGSHD
jgi:hypothetical protein